MSNHAERALAIAKTLADVLPRSLDAYAVITAAESVARNNFSDLGVKFDHDALVKIAQDSSSVNRALVDGKKITAIKTLRDLTRCGLKEAKDAVDACPVYPPYDYNESPF